MKFDPAFTYRMPVAFGPMPGPRQALPGSELSEGEAWLKTFSLRFRTTEEALQELLPPSFILANRPIVTVEFTELSHVPWLAGRGYNTLAIKLPVRFDGTRDHVTGPFVAVVWESKADPIITGREELGYAKLFADLESRSEGEHAHRCTATWEGHVFAELEFVEITDAPPRPAEKQDGTINYRYVPGIGAGEAPDAMGAVLTPTVDDIQVLRYATSKGSFRFLKSSWSQLPTFYNVVNALGRLPMLGTEVCELRHVKRNIENLGQKRLI